VVPGWLQLVIFELLMLSPAIVNGLVGVDRFSFLGKRNPSFWFF